MAEVECFVCKARGKKKFTFEIGEMKPGQIFNCPQCQIPFKIVSRNGKLRLEYPDIPLEQQAGSDNFDNMSNIGGMP